MNAQLSIRLLMLLLVCCAHSAFSQVLFLRPFATTADMIASNPNNPHTTVQVNGLTTESDGSGGRWKWYPGDTTATNTTTVFASTWAGASGRWKKINDTPASSPPDISGFITNYTVITVPTIPTMQSVNVSNGIQLVTVEGYYDKNDGGGGDFVYDTTTTDAADGGVLFSPNTGSGKWRRIIDPLGGVRVPWWGYVTNETLEAAINYASTHTNAQSVIIPGGVYQIDGTKGVTMKSNIRLVGDAGASLAVAPNPSTNYQIMDFATGSTNMSIINIDFQGWPNAPGASSNFGRAFTVAGVTNLGWIGCSFTNFWSEPIKMGTNNYAEIYPLDRWGNANSVLAFGVTQEDGNNDSKAISEAVLWARGSLSKELVFPSGHYWSTNNNEVGGITLKLNDAFLYDWRLTITDTNYTKIEGGHFRYYDKWDVTEVVSVSGAKNVWIDKADFYYDAIVATNIGPGYVDHRDKIAWTPIELAGNARNISITDCNLDHPKRAALIILGAEDIRVTGCRLHSVDDGISIKAAGNPSKGLLVSNCYFTNNATVLGIGTEIAYPVTDILVSGILAENVATALDMKPGNRFYNSNKIENVTFENIKIYDTNGVRYQYGMTIQAYAGSRVSDLVFRNIDIVARCATNQEPRSFGEFRAQATPQVIESGTISGITRSGSTATVTTATDFVKNGWTVIISGSDQTEYNGTNLVTSASVGTFTYTVSGTPATPATGTMTVKRDYTSMVPNVRNVRFENIYGRSPATGGGYQMDTGFSFLPFEGAVMTNISIVNAYVEGLEGPPVFIRNFLDTNYSIGTINDLTIDGLTARDHNRVSTSAAAVIINGDPKAKLTRIDVERPSALSVGIPALSVRTNSVVTSARGTGTTGKFYKGRNQTSRRVWVAPEQSWVHTIRMLSTTTITQSDVDYLTFNFRNVDTGQVVATNNTTTTGLNLVANTVVTLNSENLYAGSGFARNSPLLLDITHVGAGVDVDDLSIIVEYVPFGGGISSGGGHHGPQDLGVIQPQLLVRGSGVPQMVVESTSGTPESRISFADSIGGTPTGYLARDGVGNRFNLVAGAASQEMGFYAAGPMVFAPGFQTQRGKWFGSGGLVVNAAADTADPGGYYLMTRAGNSTGQVRVGGTLYVDGVQVSNVDAGEDDLKTRSILANTLNQTYGSIYFQMVFTFAANANSKQVKAYLQTSQVYASSAQNQNGGALTLEGRIMRGTSATDTRVNVWTTGTTLYPAGTTYTVTAEDVTTALTLKATGEGVGSADIAQRYLFMRWDPLH